MNIVLLRSNSWVALRKYVEYLEGFYFINSLRVAARIFSATIIVSVLKETLSSSGAQCCDSSHLSIW